MLAIFSEKQVSAKTFSGSHETRHRHAMLFLHV